MTTSYLRFCSRAVRLGRTYLRAQSYSTVSGIGILDRLNGKSKPAEREILAALQKCQDRVSERMKEAVKRQGGTKMQRGTEGGIGPAAILSLDKDDRKQTTGELESITDLAFRLVTHPAVFVTAHILSSYVELQSLIRDPTPIPAVFALYAKKPYTPPGLSRMIEPNPRQAKYAVPEKTASAALGAAIDAKDISVCLDVIDTSFATPAFQRAKLIRKATPVGLLGALIPPLAFAAADVLARFQDEVDHALAVKVAFVGFLTYAGAAGGMALLAALSANGHMIRVTWVPGTPLGERWLREEERAALDRVAQAWGFEDPSKRGFEEGEEWELLREVVMRKGMVLDNSSLMVGME